MWFFFYHVQHRKRKRKRESARFSKRSAAVALERGREKRGDACWHDRISSKHLVIVPSTRFPQELKYSIKYRRVDNRTAPDDCTFIVRGPPSNSNVVYTLSPPLIRARSISSCSSVKSVRRQQFWLARRK